MRLRRLRRARLRAIAEGAEHLQPFLLAEIFEEIRAAQQHIIVLGQLGAEERVAHFLVSAARRTGADRKRPVAIDLPMTRQDIADYLGLTIETVMPGHFEVQAGWADRTGGTPQGDLAANERPAGACWRVR